MSVSELKNQVNKIVKSFPLIFNQKERYIPSQLDEKGVSFKLLKSNLKGSLVK